MMTSEELMKMMSHKNGEVVIIETSEGIKKRIFCDGELYDPNPLYDFMVKIINKVREENKEMKSLLNELLDNSSCFTRAIELDLFIDGEEWEKKARKITGNEG